MKSFVIKNDWLDRKYIDFGWGNGYVVIPKGHPMNGINYDDIDVDVHGGLTLSESVEEMLTNGTDKYKNHLLNEDPAGWVVGFDTAHGGDTIDNCPKEYVIEETERLRRQLEAYEILTQTPV